jgi:Ca2+-binding RTX toxin-like protein
MQLNFGNNIISSAYYDDVNEKAYMYPYGDGQGSHLSVRALNQIGYDNSSALSIFGTAYNDLIAGQESSNSAALTINSYAGLDVIDISNHTGADTVDAGAGNDIVHVNSSYASDTSIDGGAGTDWLIILSGSSSVNYTINSSSTSNFENVRTGTGDDAVTGDDNANRLVGWGGADTLSGGAGDDELYGYVDQNPQGVTDGIDSLYGGAGDDSLYGGAGDDLLDGGTGRDVLSGEGASGSYDNGGANGADTFVIREGDGGSALELADVITDFEDGDDIIGMSGLNYSDLTIEQGTGSYSSHVVVKKTDSGEFLVIIRNIELSNVDDRDFSAI